jgi:hypothetical protein
MLLGGTLYFTWVCAEGLGLVHNDISPAVAAAIKRRIVIGQSLYAFGALFCLVSTYVSIAFIVSGATELRDRAPPSRSRPRVTPSLYRAGTRPGVHGAPAASSACSSAFRSTSTSTRSFSRSAANSWLATA